MRLLITGAAGRIGRALTEGLSSSYSLRLADLRPPEGEEGGEWIACDVTDPGDAARAVEGMDAVIHLAGHPNSTDWDVVQRLNVGGTLAMLRASANAGVKRFLFASSVHAFGMHPADTVLTSDLPPHPDGPYGVSKSVGETLVRYFADFRGMSGVAMRICSFRPEPGNARELATWLSPGDMVRLAEACLSADLDGFAGIWGISANSGARIDDETWSRLGYRPVDDAAAHADRLASEGVDLSRYSEWPLLGGEFVNRARAAIDTVEPA